MNELEAAYKFCQQTTRVHAKSFYFSARFLPAHKRQAIYAVYALCRQVDDAVDTLEHPTEAAGRAAIENWRQQLEAVYRGADDSQITSPVLYAWRDMLPRYAIPFELPLELMRGVVTDTHKNRYASWSELKLYCYRVASVVGLMVTPIFGYRGGAETLRCAEALGYAMQLTNILRDVGEDARLNRIYLPQEDLREFAVSEQDVMKGRVSEDFKRLMSFEIKRAREFYREAEKGIPMLDKDARFTVLLAARIYAAILDEIEAADYDVFTFRAHTTLRKKMRFVPRVWRESRAMAATFGAKAINGI